MTRNSFCITIFLVMTVTILIRDKMLAYSTYRNQWTSSGDKKLVVDASKVGENFLSALVLVTVVPFLLVGCWRWWYVAMVAVIVLMNSN